MVSLDPLSDEGSIPSASTNLETLKGGHAAALRRSKLDDLPRSADAGPVSPPTAHFSVRRAMWSSLDLPGLECVWFEGRSATGTILRADERGSPYRVSYRFTWKGGFQPTQARIEVAQESEARALELAHDRAWRDSQGELTSFEGCRDVDLWPTPLTNSLTIRRLDLAIDERAEVDVLWIEAPMLRLERVRQVYTRVDEHGYRFQSPASGFEAVLQCDEDGLVIEYPGLFRRER